MAALLPARSVTLFGLPIAAHTPTETVELIMHQVLDGVATTHSCVNAAKIVAMERDPALRAAVRSCDVISADGQGIVLASRILGTPVPARVAGVDLMFDLLSAAEANGLSVYFLGSTPARLDSAVREARRRWPRLDIAGYRDGYFQRAELPGVIQQIRTARPAFLFVGITSPLKEEIVASSDSAALFAMGVGGALDVLGGAVRRAPVWIQRAGLEWAWRVAQEPRRLWRRYLVSNVRFARMVASEFLATRRRR